MFIRVLPGWRRCSEVTRLPNLVRALCASAMIVACGNAEPTPPPSAGETPVAPVACAAAMPFPPHQDLTSIRAEIEARAAGEFTSIGNGATTVMVGLRARAECLARQIVAAYGPSVEVTVGLLPFPPRPQAKRGCQVGGPFGAVPLLQATLEVPSQVERGEWFKGNVRFANVGPAPISLVTSSSFTVYLFPLGNQVAIGTSEGGSMGTGLAMSLAPGQTEKVKAFGGTASCDLALGYALPVGQYRARALIDYSPPDGAIHYFWSDPTPVEIIAP
jgi:hypothetical protein